jgi:predicted metalloprotease with PDZ domain
MTTFARRALVRALCIFAFLSLAPSHALRARETSAPVYKISYRLSMPNPASHLFEVRVDVRGLLAATADHVDFQMPRWSPGRYAVFDFAKNVQEASVSPYCKPDTKCERASFRAERLDTQTWRAEARGADGVTFSYKVFADDLSGTFSQLDARHANFNGGSVFVYVVGHKQDATSLKIDAPAGWKIINGGSKGTGQSEFNFPNYDLLIDTPTEIAPDFNVQTFDVAGKTYRVVIHSMGGDEGGRRAELAKSVERIVRVETERMPTPDYEQYTFLFHFDPTARRGDGMEHLNSTQIIETGLLANRDVYEGALSTAAHEFFHVWNVKRMRPVGLGPWDFTRPVVTRGLWIAEGFTNYYGKLSLRRAGIWDDEQLFKSYAAAIGGIENAQGSKLTSAVEASILAPFIDRSMSDQRTNLANTVVSYYPKGETLAVVLDLLIRGRTKGRASLDDVMRRAYEEFYLKSASDSYYLKGRGYTVEEFERVASEAAGFDLSDFFRRHVYGVEPPPYDEALAYMGLRMTRTPAEERRPQDAGITTAPVITSGTTPPASIVASVRKASPAELAGIRPGDEIISIGGREANAANWLELINATGGARFTIVVRRAGQSISFDITPTAEAARTTYRIDKDKAATAEARALREAWLAGK